MHTVYVFYMYTCDILYILHMLIYGKYIWHFSVKTEDHILYCTYVLYSAGISVIGGKMKYVKYVNMNICIDSMMRDLRDMLLMKYIQFNFLYVEQNRYYTVLCSYLKANIVLQTERLNSTKCHGRPGRLV